MANVIKHKRGSGSDPVANDLVVGEVAIRTDVGKLFTKMDNGSVAEIAGGGSDIAINTLSSSSATGGGSATFNGSAFRFTLSAPPSVSAQQLLVSINGVIQKPVAGTGQPSEGFSVDGTDIILGDAPATGADFFILTFKSLGVSEPADNSVTSAKIVDGAIVNADINASAAIAGTKISPDFGSQTLTTTGTVNTGLINASSASDQILNLNSSDNGAVYLAFKRSGGRKAYFGYGGTGNTISLVNEISDGDIVIAGNDGGSNINMLSFNTSENGRATFIGDIVVGGTVDGVDIAALSSTVSGKLSDVVDDTSPQLGGNLQSNGNNINIADSTDGATNRLTVGSGGDLQVFHDSNNSKITHGGAGGLYIGADTFALQKGDHSETYISVTANGAVELYHDNDRVFYTETRGVRIGDNTKIFENSSHNTAIMQHADIHHAIIFRGATNNNGSTITNENTTTFREYGQMQFRTGGNGNMPVRLTIASDGLVSGNLEDTSDAKFKENIVSIEDGAISKIKQLRPVNFDWKEEMEVEDAKNSSGFIAQEVLTVIPNLVGGTEYNGDENSSGYSINTSGLVAYLTKALQEVIGRIEALEAK